MRLPARVNGSPSWQIQSRSDSGWSPTVGRLRAVVRITYYMASISHQLIVFVPYEFAKEEWLTPRGM